jgi:hypothetical protein
MKKKKSWKFLVVGKGGAGNLVCCVLCAMMCMAGSWELGRTGEHDVHPVWISLVFQAFCGTVLLWYCVTVVLWVYGLVNGC